MFSHDRDPDENACNGSSKNVLGNIIAAKAMATVVINATAGTKARRKTNLEFNQAVRLVYSVTKIKMNVEFKIAKNCVRPIRAFRLGGVAKEKNNVETDQPSRLSPNRNRLLEPGDDLY